MLQKPVNHSRKYTSSGRRRGFLRVLHRQTSRLFRKLFRNRKIVIISDKEIVSIPVSTSFQASLCLVILLVTGWVSYSSGRYLTVRETLLQQKRTFQESLQEKDKEITVTNLTNKDLLSQVTDLQRNLMRINSYFESTVHGPNLPTAPSQKATSHNKASTRDERALLNKVESMPVATAEDVEMLRETASNTLHNIDQQIKAKIKTLEKAVALTGLELGDVTDIADASSDKGAAGGPYFSGDDTSVTSQKQAVFPLPKNLGKSIDYLLQLEEVVYALPLAKPEVSARITSGFGHRIDPIRGTPATHYGLDFAGPANSKIYATAPGVVSMAQRTGAYGNLVEIDHGNGIKTRYGHLSRILVRPGMKVQRGQVIGIQGSTGRSTGAHLHYEVRYNDVPRNPQNFIKAGSYVFSQRKS